MSQSLRSNASLSAAAAALVLLSGCQASGQSGGSAALPAPLPEGSPRVITAADAGTTVAVGVGETIAVTLVGVPTAGYVWEADAVPAFLSAAETLSGPTIAAQNEPGFAGGNHWETLTFRVDAAGEGALTLAQRRPWETDEPPSQTFEVAIKAE